MRIEESLCHTRWDCKWRYSPSIRPKRGLFKVKTGIRGYLGFYNEQRLHQSLNDKTPREISLGKTSWNQQEKQGILGTRLLP